MFAAYFRLDEMEAHFIASDLVSFNRKFLGNGPLGRMKRVRQIAALTGRFTHSQMLDPYAVMEAEIFPEHLKKWVKIPGLLFRLALTGTGLLILCFSAKRLFSTLSKPASDLELIFLSTLIACLSLAFINVLMKVWISFFRLAEIESLLKESYFVARNRRVMGNSVVGRYFRLSHISTMLLLEDDFVSRSDPHAMDELARLPKCLRRLVIIPTRMLAYSFLGFCVVYLSGKLFGVFA
ncbi:hypothetical protein GIW70_23130 [Pseudomonas syringae]|nr:hypothetical protein [Pseudomonas syringae]MCF5071072.1 hypothetical protein [Pseudomonas syringae]